MARFDDAIELGVVVRAHGVRGALKVVLHNPDSTTLADVDNADLALRLSSGTLLCGPRLRTDSRAIASGVGSIVIDHEAIGDRDAADATRGAVLVVARAAVPLESDEFLYADLIGCQVLGERGPLGQVVDIFHAGASDVLVVRDGDDERLIPFVAPWIVDVALDRRQISVTGDDEWEVYAADRGSSQSRGKSS